MNAIATSVLVRKAPAAKASVGGGDAVAARWTSELNWQGLGRLLIRPLTPDDLELERRFVGSLSDETLLRRARGAQASGDEVLNRLIRFDRSCELALAAIRRDDEGDELIAVARFSRARHPGDARFAIVVADRYQRHCLGTELMCRLLDAAATMGYRRLVGYTLTPNAPMLCLARRMGCRVMADPQDSHRQRLSVPVRASPVLAQRAVSRRPPRTAGATG